MALSSEEEFTPTTHGSPAPPSIRGDLALEYSMYSIRMGFRNQAGPARSQPIATPPVSPVRIRMHSSRSRMKILPSPICPVRAPAVIASTVGLT